MIVYVSSRVDNPYFEAIEVSAIDKARSLVRGLLASHQQFIFRGCGWCCVRGGYGGSVDWFPDDENWGGWSWSE